jgi:hypothetical protein
MPTRQTRILIVDDEPDRSKGWAKSIQAFGLPRAAVTALDLDASRALIEAADKRRRLAREEKDPFASGIECELDHVDLLVVDYDLQEMVETGQWSTGLWVAMLARAFTRVKLIVLVNQFGTNMFDLTLSKAVKSRSDFDVGSAQLLNPALWDWTRVDGYAPWSWCDGVLPAVDRLDAVVDWMHGKLDEPVLGALGFGNGIEGSDPDTWISQELWQECVGDPTRTFREMVDEAEFLTVKDRAFIKKFDEPCARVAAAVVSHWLDRWVIPSNDVLADLLHLTSASPWLLMDRQDVGAWQATTHRDGFRVLLPAVQKHEFLPQFPLSRPVVWRKKVMRCPELAEPTGFTYDGFPDVVFCEDTSQFQSFVDARSFSSRLPGSDPQRWVANPERVAPESGGHGLTDVSYEPSVLFAL